MKSSNPALKEKLFGGVIGQTDDMTVDGTVTKTAFLLLLLLCSAAFAWAQVAPQMGFDGMQLRGNPMPFVLIGGIGGFVVALATMFKAAWSPMLAPAYALLEGLLIGAISAIFEAKYPGVVMQATVGTFATLGAMLLAYRLGWVQVTDSFRMGVTTATMGIALMYFVTWILSFFGVPVNFLHDSSPLSIGISVLVVALASLNLVLDFDFVAQGAARRAPKYMEWYGAFALTVTLVWLYMEILRLLGKINDRK